jgi:hypothetical protein
MPRTGPKQDGPHLDFFILGGSKSGKSALRAYLRTHPRIFMAMRELNFYADDLSGSHTYPPRPAKSRQVFCEMFSGAVGGQLLGEASGAYLLSERAVPNILKDNPDARFIIMLRNPIDMARAMHADLLGRQVEDERSFQKAWELQDTRAAGKQIPRACKEPKLLLYRERSSFASQIERFFQRAPRERTLVHVFEEFFADPRAAYQRTLVFLGLPDDGRTHFARVNEHGVPRSGLLHRLSLNPPFPLDRVFFPLKRAFNAFGLRPVQAYFRRTLAPPLDPSFRCLIEGELRPDVERLEAICGRDLNVWKFR